MIDTKPFIKLFKAATGFFMYDVNRNAIIKISADIYDHLDRVQNGSISLNGSRKPEVKETIDRMVENGYLSSNRVKHIEFTTKDIIKYQLENNLSNLILQVTQDCNLRCKYCIYVNHDKGLQRDHSKKKMKWITAKKGIDFLIRNSKDSKKINIGFYGGEPLLEYSFIVKCVEYAKKESSGKRLTFSMTTNATLLTPDIFRYLIDNGFIILISLDGPKEIHDKNRVFENGSGSYDSVMSKLDEISELYPDDFHQLGFNMVMDSEIRFSCYAEFCTSNKLFETSTLSAALAQYRYGEVDINTHEMYYEDYEYEKFKYLLSELGRLKKTNVSKSFSGFMSNFSRLKQNLNNISKLPEICHHSGPCTPGKTRLFLSCDGIFYPCERVSETSQVTSIGNIDDGFNYKKVYKVMNIGQISAERCRKCWQILHCRLCLASVDNLTDFSDEKKEIICRTNEQSLISEFIDLVTFEDCGIKIEEWS